MHKEDNTRIRYKKTCPHCGKKLNSDDIVKGYEYDKDHYVIVTDEEVEKIKSDKEKSIQILHLAQLDQISPIYYEKTYQVTPEPGGEKAFELLRSALIAEKKIAIGKTVLGMKDTLVAIIPRENGMLISTMFYEDEVMELPKSYNKPEILQQELDMAKTLINSMDTPFDPSMYHDEYQIKLKELIEAKINGKEIVAAQKGSQGNVINLMDALKASIEQQKENTKTKRGPKKEKGA